LVKGAEKKGEDETEETRKVRTVASPMMQVASPLMKLGADRLVKNCCTLKNKNPLIAAKQRHHFNSLSVIPM